jgi:ATP-binding cassette subfamily F protein 3
VIQFHQLTKSYGMRDLFRDQTLTLLPKEKIGLVGRNGHGKTTLMKILIGEVLADGGEVRVAKNFRLGHLQQHLHFTQTTVLEEAREGLPAEEKEATYKIEKCLFGLGFSEEQLHLDPHLLSGGFHLRLELAKVILSDPDCLLLDEPTNYLDIGAIKWLVRFLRQWDKGCLLISHDRSFLDDTCDFILGIHRGQFRKTQGNTEKYYECLLAEEELHEKTLINQEKKIKKMEAFVERFKAKASKAKQAQSRLKALNKMTVLEKLEELEELEFSFPHTPCPGKVLLKAHDLSFGYSPDQLLVNQLPFLCSQQDRIGIIGRNGKGKSTLLKLIAGELTPTQGHLTHHPALKKSYFGQTHIQQFDPENSILEELQKLRPDLPLKTVRAICGHVLFSGDDAFKKMKTLSGGERSRVMLGKMLLTPSNLLLMDEPSHHLDMESVERLTQALEDFPGAVIVVSHDEDLLRRLCDRLYIFIHDHILEYPRGYEEFEKEGGLEEFEKQRTLPSNIKEKQNAKVISPEEKKRQRLELQKKRSQELTPLKKAATALEESIKIDEEKLEQLTQSMTSTGDKNLSWEAQGKERKLLSDRLQKSYDDWENHLKKIEECEEKYEHLLRPYEK